MSACSLFFTMVMITESSIDPVGAPAPISRVRTIVEDWSRSDWMSDGVRRHCETSVLTSCVLVELEATLPLVESLVLVEPVAERLELAEVSLLATAPVDVEPLLLLAIEDGELVLPVALVLPWAVESVLDIEEPLVEPVAAKPPLVELMEPVWLSEELELLDGDDVPLVS